MLKFKDYFVFSSLFFAACASDGTLSDSAGGSTNVTQGGTRDIARFRKALAHGNVPSTEMFDDVGFFAEHALDLPPADCGTDVCFHPMLAVAPTFSGKNWTTAFVAMNSAVDPATRERPRAHLVLAIETSPLTDDMSYVLDQGVRALAESLREDDLLSIVMFNDRASTLASTVAPDSEAIGRALYRAHYGYNTYYSERGVALYDGLATAGQIATSVTEPGVVSRIVLLTSGNATRGITDPARILALAEGLAERGVALSVIGLGEATNRLPTQLGQIGAGTFAYALTGMDLMNILAAEGETSLLPLATSLRVAVEAAPGYRIGRIHGVPRAHADLSRAYLSTPALYLGQRSGSMDVANGRRGGGGGLFVELIADPSRGANIRPASAAFTLRASWINQRTGEEEKIARAIINPLEPGQNPPGTFPFFSDPSRSKAFMMLNMYTAIRGAVDLYEAGDCKRAMGLVDMMSPMITEYQRMTGEDPDIEADAQLLLQVRTNIARQCTGRTPVQPRDFGGGCFFI